MATAVATPSEVSFVLAKKKTASKLYVFPITISDHMIIRNTYVIFDRFQW